LIWFGTHLGLGGSGAQLKLFAPLLSLMRVPELKQVLETENETATAQRLGYIVEKAGKKALAKAIRDWLPSQLSLVPLTPSKADQASAQMSQRWRIIDNSGDLAP
jgi:hypothetical protein